MNKPNIIEIKSNLDFKNTSVFIDGVPVQDCINMTFRASEYGVILSYVVANKMDDGVFYELNEFVLEPSVSEQEKSYSVIKNSSRIVAYNDIGDYVRKYFIGV